jgi:hypothetical protein
MIALNLLDDCGVVCDTSVMVGAAAEKKRQSG